MKYLMTLLFFAGLSMQALTIEEYQELKSEAYSQIKDHMEIHKDPSLQEIQKPIFKARHKLLKAVAENDEKMAELFEALKSAANTSESKGLYKTKRDIEHYLITEIKGQDEYSELYTAWHEARTAYENQKARLLKQKDLSTGNAYQKIIRKIQTLRTP